MKKMLPECVLCALCHVNPDTQPGNVEYTYVVISFSLFFFRVGFFIRHISPDTYSENRVCENPFDFECALNFLIWLSLVCIFLALVRLLHFIVSASDLTSHFLFLILFYFILFRFFFHYAQKYTCSCARKSK